jgi:hypothetical protein
MSAKVGPRLCASVQTERHHRRVNCAAAAVRDEVHGRRRSLLIVAGAYGGRCIILTRIAAAGAQAEHWRLQPLQGVAALSLSRHVASCIRPSGAVSPGVFLTDVVMNSGTRHC